MRKCVNPKIRNEVAVPQASHLFTRDDVENAGPGNYVVSSDTEAYFPTLALIEDGDAEFVGERYDENGDNILAVGIGGSARSNPEDESFSGEIGIGQEFFSGAMRDYKDWQLSWWREVIQNSVDAGAKNIDLGTINNADGTKTVFCEDDGGGMSKDVLANKFLYLGKTTKTAESGAAGGFGKAKELILLPWISWKVRSQDHVFSSGGGRAWNADKAPFLQGTRVEVVMPADNTTHSAYAVNFIEHCYLPKVRFTVDGAKYDADLKSKTLITTVTSRGVDMAKIYFTPLAKGQTSNRMFVRTKGLYMFPEYLMKKLGAYVIVELLAPSVTILTANRDGFGAGGVSVKYAIQKLAEKIATEKDAALRSKRGQIRQKFVGAGKFRAKKLAAGLFGSIGPVAPVEKKLSEADTQEIIKVVDDYNRKDAERESSSGGGGGGGVGSSERVSGTPAGSSSGLPSSATARVLVNQPFTGPKHLEAALKQLVWEPDFFIINDIEDFKVPKKFFPATMTRDVLFLAKTWVEMVRYVMMQLGSALPFGAGWHFSANAAASAVTETNENDDKEYWILLNPFVKMVEGEVWQPNKIADLKWLYAAAVHEATHIVDGVGDHDVAFAIALTYNIARTADGFAQIQAIVDGIGKAPGAPVRAGEGPSLREPMRAGPVGAAEFAPVAASAAASYISFATKGSYSLNRQGMNEFLRRYVGIVKRAVAAGASERETWAEMWTMMNNELEGQGYLYDPVYDRVAAY